MGEEHHRAITKIAKTIVLGIAFAICISLGACVSDRANRYYGSERFAARPVNDVEILREASTRPYVVIADFQARGADADDMRKEAAAIGADAVIVGTYGGYRSKSDKWAGQDKHSDSYSRITGTAIRYKTEK